MIHKILLFLIISLAVYFRFSGINWDANWHLHPDERFLTMVADKLTWPASFFDYLNTATSPLNPHNNSFDFYVYGTYPVIFVKFIAEILNKGDYNGITQVGRVLSAIIDLLTMLVVYLIANKLTSNKTVGLVSAFVYSVSVLPIQLSHFFAVDPYLVFFLTLSFYFLIHIVRRPVYIIFIFLGISFAMAVAAKISAILFLPIIGLGIFASFIRSLNKLPFSVYLLLFVSFYYFVVRLAYPYLFSSPKLDSFSLNPKLVANLEQLKSFDNPHTWFPPATMWISSRSYIFPLENLVLWGLGLPLGVIALVSVLYTSLRYHRHLLTLCVIWIFGLFIFQGGQFVKAMRYFYPIYPFLAITSAIFVSDLYNKFKILAIMFCLLALVWPLAFISIYTRPHSRVAASDWIYKNIPVGSTISCEYWDDCLPLGGSGSYHTVEYRLYDPDTSEKWQEIITKLSQTDYIILSSNRLYGSILSVPDRYPITTKFYSALFDGSLGFTIIAEFASRPSINLPLPALCLTPPSFSYHLPYGYVAQNQSPCPSRGTTFVDDFSDESFTVYDHPKVIIFKKR